MDLAIVVWFGCLLLSTAWVATVCYFAGERD